MRQNNCAKAQKTSHKLGGMAHVHGLGEKSNDIQSCTRKHNKNTFMYVEITNFNKNTHKMKIMSPLESARWYLI